jgi:hypothetical protein
MKTPSFLEGVVVAFVASVAGAAWLWTLAMFVPPGIACKLVIATLAFGYLLYLLRRSGTTQGRTVAVSVWLGVATISWLLPVSMITYLLIHTVILCLLRSLYFHSRLTTTLGDLVLTTLSVSTALWAAYWTGSMLLSLWCFFVTQAAFVAIPGVNARTDTRGSSSNDASDVFARAHRAADSALRKLSMTSTTRS